MQRDSDGNKKKDFENEWKKPNKDSAAEWIELKNKIII